MAPAAKLDPATEFQNGVHMPDFSHYREKFGWPESDASGYKITEQLCGTERPLRVVAVGGGVSGINLAKFLPEQLNNVSLTVYEKNPELGGTWYENKYPGVRCDIPSHNYQFTWARYPEWKEYYSSGREIQNYLLNVVRQFDLRKYFHTNHEVVGATWDEKPGVWHVQVKNLLSGAVFTDTAEIFINNDGLLNKWKWPKIDGLTDYKGLLCHTADYDPSTVLDGKRVAVIGIGSSGLQVVPSIQPKVAQLYAFIRSPTWVTPMIARKFLGSDGTSLKYTQEQKAEFRANPVKYQEYLKGLEIEINSRFRGILQGTPEALEAKKVSLDFMTSRLDGRIDIIDAIIPKNFGLGCRRPTPGTGFLEALSQPNVTTFTKALTKITEKGFIDHEGNEHEADVIICATGFDVSWIPRFPIWVDGTNVQDVRRKEILSYLSLAIPDVPNYFGVVGPYGPFAHGCYITVSELLTQNVVKVIKKVQRELIKSVRPKREVCEAFAQHADLFAQRTAWVGPCSSWFKNGHVNGRLAVFPGSRLVYWELLTDPRWEDYNIDYVEGNEFNFMGNGFHIREFVGADKAYYLGANNDPPVLLQPATNGHAPADADDDDADKAGAVGV